jgi:hypothetical protein
MEIELDRAASAEAKDAIRSAYKPKMEGLQDAIQTKDSDKAAANLERKAQIAAIEQKYLDEVAAIIDVPIDQLEAKLAALRAKQYAAILASVDQMALQLVRVKFQPQIESLQARIKVKETQMGLLANERNAEVAKVEARFAPEIAKLQVKEEPLEYKLIRLQEQEWAELLPLIDPAKIRAIEAQYEPRIAALVKTFLAHQAQAGKLWQRAQQDMNRIQLDHGARIARLEGEIIRLMRQKRK